MSKKHQVEAVEEVDYVESRRSEICTAMPELV